MTNSLLSLKVITPEGAILEMDGLTAINVQLADENPIGIRPGHAPLLSSTKQGVIKIKSAKGVDSISLRAGVLKIRKNQVTILTSGVVTDANLEPSQPDQNEFERLMNTLVNQFSNEDLEKRTNNL
jgi:F0F1-type ATP synthase epsilon subunit